MPSWVASPRHCRATRRSSRSSRARATAPVKKTRVARPSWRQPTNSPRATCGAGIGNATAALQSYEAAEVIWHRLNGLPGIPQFAREQDPVQSEGPENRLALAILLDNIGTLHQHAGELEKAVGYYSQAMQIEWLIVRDGKKPRETTRLAHHLATMLTKLGSLQVELHMATDALRWVVGNAVIDAADFGAGTGGRFPFYTRAESILESLIRDAPTDERINDFRRDLANCREHNAKGLLEISNRAEDALSSYREALAIRQRLAAGESAVTEYQEGLARIDFEIGLLHDRSGKRDLAAELYRQAVDHQAWWSRRRWELSPLSGRWRAPARQARRGGAKSRPPGAGDRRCPRGLARCSSA